MARSCVAVAVAAALMVSAGCSLMTDLSGLSERADGVLSEAGVAITPAEAGPPTAPDSAPDSATTFRDASASEGGPVVGVEPCAGKHLFCTDFDTRALKDEWEVVTPGDGTLDRNTTSPFSAPFSLEMTHPPGNPGSTPAVAKTVPAAGAGGLKCSFRYRRDAVDDAGVLVVLIADFNTTTAEHVFAEIKDGKTNGRVYLNVKNPEGIVSDDFPIVPTFAGALGAWALVEWTLDLRAKRSTLSSDAKIIDQRAFGYFNPANLTTIKLTLGLGNFTAPTAPWRVRYDDFVCDALP